MKFPRLLFALLLSPLAGAAGLHAATVGVYLSAPYTQQAADSGTTTGAGQANTINELFESFAQGKFTSLTSSSLTGIPGAVYTSSTHNSTINANGQYGGGLQGQYLGVASNDSVTLQLATPVTYLGLEWCAVDSGNSLTVYDQYNHVIGTFNAATFASILPDNSTSMVTAINGTKYNTINYFGRPTGDPATTTNISNRQDNSQQFAYLNFIAEPGSEISKVVFSETGAVFEMDNNTVLTTTPTVLGSYVPLGDIAPEPSAMLCLLAGAAAVLCVRHDRRSRA